jgi:hypothetical protein
MSLPPPDLPRLLREGVELGSGSLRGSTTVVDVGALEVPSGRLVMDDPLVDTEPPFAVSVPPGAHRVVLVVVAVRDTTTPDEPPDERVALAIVLVGGAALDELRAPELTYEEVVPDDEDAPDELGEDEFFGYGVDSGTGCFADADRLMLDGREEEWQEALLDELDRTARDTWSTAVVSDATVVAFSTGWGDGVYPSWGVRGDDGRLLAVVTDFLVARDVEHHADTVPADGVGGRA